ncbi:MAG: arsenate reductase family protein [Clostridioides sp.]|jgi:arsenate reductase|nr:arsenate reductase family protein [Clostridioides sp.]
MLKVYGYSRCSTVKKAKKWLDDNDISYEDIDMVQVPPTKEELEEIYNKSGLEIKRFFNTSGMKYRELGLKDVVKTKPVDELLSILSSDGMLIKRPMVVGNDFVLLGFKEEEWKKTFKK